MTDTRPSWLPDALGAVRDRTARVAVLGCGYVGLSLALGCARAGFRVLGVEPAEDRAKGLAAGENPVPDVDVPPGELSQLADEGRLTFSTTLDATADVFAICVPTPLRDGSPDLHFVEAAGEAIARVLRLGSLVVLESTTYPGTTEELLLPLLEERSGLTAGESFALGHSPERIDPGNTDWGIHNTPKVVGGLTPASTELATAFYSQFCEHVIPVSSPRAAEMVKLLENTYRHVNIALANEMSMISHDLEVDPWEVIDAAASKPFGFTPFKPGPGVGGHCLLPGERVYVRNDDGVRILSVEEAWAEAAAEGAPVVLDGVDVTTPSGTEVAALSEDLGDWNHLSALGRRRYAGEALQITTRDGRILRVTVDHPMLVHADGSLTTRTAGDLRKGDLLPIWADPDTGQVVPAPELVAVGDRPTDSGPLAPETESSRSYAREGELHLVPVERVDRFRYQGYVYSLETRPSHTFAASHGILVHNCIPVDPQYLAWRVRGRLGHQFRLLETAEDLNQRMPAYVVQRSGEILNEAGKAVRGAKVLVLGVAYKGGSADLRESPALRVIERLGRSGADISYHDPHVPELEMGDLRLESVELTDERLRDADLVLVLTDHPEVDYELVLREAEAVFDTRGVTWGMDLPPDARVYRG